MKNRILKTAFIWCYITMAAVSLSFALPSYDNVESGSATFDKPNDTTLNITASDKTVINFSSFNIAQNETVNFFQPSVSASVLARVISPTSSEIAGKLFANGALYLINANGIHFTPTANVQANIFVASTLDIATNNFINGSLVFEKGQSSSYALIINEGRISANNIALLGSAIANRSGGIISARAGMAHLVSGDKATVSFDNKGLLQVVVDKDTSGKVIDETGATIKDAINNAGTVEAAKVYMSANTASDIFEKAMNQTGIVRGVGFVNEGGVIRVVAKGKVALSGTMETTSTPDSKGLVDVKTTDSIEVTSNLATSGDTKLSADKGINITATVTTTGGDLYLDSPGTITIADLNTPQGSVYIGTVTKPALVQSLSNTSVTANMLKAVSDKVFLNSSANTTHIVKDTTVYIEALNKDNNLITIEGATFGRLTYSAAKELILETSADMITAPGVFISGYSVKVIARHFGSNETPLSIDAATTHFKLTGQDMSIQESTGMGTSILLRGPPEGFGAIIYSSSTNLTLESETGRVTISDNDPISLYGNITFYNFYCNTPGKEIYFEAGKTYTFKGLLDIQGVSSASGLIHLFSQEKGTPWYIDVATSDYNISAVGVGDSHSIGAFDIMAHPKSDFGGNIGWAHNDSVYWTGASSALWSVAGNWNAHKPGVGDAVIFDTGSVAATIDEAFSIASLTLNGYTGTITQSAALTISGDYSQTGGTFAGGSVAITVSGNFTLSGGAFTSTSGMFTVGGSWTKTGGTFTAGTGTITFNSTGTQTITSGGSSFNNVIFDGVGGKWAAADNMTVANDVTVTNGNFDLTGVIVGGAVTVASSGSTNATLGSGQRKTFYDTANSKYWTFYYNSTTSAIEYAYSADGVTWTSASSLGYNTPNFSLTYKNISSTGYVFLATEANTYDIVLVRGTLAATSISFDAAQTVFDGSATTFWYTNPAINLDADNYIWAAANKNIGGTDCQPAVRRSTNIATGDLSAWNAITNLGTLQNTLGSLVLVPQTGSNMMLICGNDSGNITAWTYDGSSWSDANAGGDYSWLTFGGVSGFDGEVRAIAIAGTNIYFGGAFTTAYYATGSVTVNYIARYSTTDNVFYTLGQGSTKGVNGKVYAIAVTSDNANVYIGGEFTVAYNLANLTANRIVRYQPSDDTFNALGEGATKGVTGSVYALAITSDDANVYIGGEFTTARNVADLSVNYITRYQPSDNIFYALGAGVTKGVTGSVYAIAITSDNAKVYIGGTFITVHNADDLNVNRITYYQPADNIFYALGLGATDKGTSGDVYAVAITSDDANVYIGGAFYGAYNEAYISSYRVTRYNVADNTFYPLSGGGVSPFAGYYVSAIAITSDNANVYIAGNFEEARDPSITVNNVVRYQPSDNKFYALGSGTTKGLNGIGRVIAISADDTDIYVGGAFTVTYDASSIQQAMSYVTKYNYNASGGMFIKVPPTASGLNGQVNAIAINGTNIYIGGAFTYAYGASGGVAVNYVARYSTIDNSFYGLGPGTTKGVNYIVNAIAVTSDGANVYLGGQFKDVYNVALLINVYYIIRYQTSNSTFYTLGEGATKGLDSYVDSLAFTHDETSLYIGGEFGTARNVANLTVNYITRYQPGNNTFYALGQNATKGVNGYVYAIAVTSDDANVYIGGSFTTASEVSVNRITCYQPGIDTFNALGLGATKGLSDRVRAIAITSDDSRVYMGGDFVTARNTLDLTVNRVTYYKPGDGLFYAMGQTATKGVDGAVYSIAVTGDDANVYIGGDFTTASGLTVNKITNYQASNDTFYALGQGSTKGANDSVRAITIASGNTFYIGGLFKAVGGNACPYLTKYALTVAAESGISAQISAVSDASGNVNLIYRDQNSDLIYKQFSAAGSTWAAAVTLYTGTISSPSISIKTSDNSLYAYWVDTNTIYMKKGISPYASANWDSSATSVYAAGTNVSVVSDYNANDSGKMVVAWTNGTEDPYSVKSSLITTVTPSLTVTGNFSNAGTFSPGTNTVVFDKGALTQTLDIGSSSFYNLTHSGAGILQLSGNNLTVGGSLDNSAGTLDLNGKNLSVTGTLTIGDGTTLKLQGNETVSSSVMDLADGSTVNYVGYTSPVTINNWSYKTLTLSGAGKTYNWMDFTTYAVTYTIDTALNITGSSGNLIILASTTPANYWNLNTTGATTAVNYVNVTDSNSTQVIIPANSTSGGHNVNWILGSTWTNAAGGNTWNTAGNWSGAAVPDQYTIAIFDATSTANCSIDTNASVYKLQIDAGYTGGSGSTITQSGANTLTVGAGGITQAAGTFSGGSGAITDSGDFALSGGAFTSTSGIFSVGGSWSRTAGTFSNHSGIVKFTATSVGKTITTGNQPYANLVFDGIGGGWTITDISTVADTLTVTNGAVTQGEALSIDTYLQTTGGTYDQNGKALSITGDFTCTAGTFTGNGGTITLEGTGDQIIIAPNATFSAVSIAHTGSVGAVSFSYITIPLGASPTSTAGTIEISAGGAITVSGDWIINGSFSPSGGTVSGALDSVTISGSFVPSVSSVFPENVPFTFNGSAAQQVNAPGVTFGTVTITQSGSGALVIWPGTTIPLGAVPLVSSPAGITNNGVITASGPWGMVGSLTNNGTISGAITSLSITGDFTNAAGATFPANVALSIGGASTATINASTVTFASITLNGYIIMASNLNTGDFTANTYDIANPATAKTLYVTGNFSGDSFDGGSNLLIEFSGSGDRTLSSASPLFWTPIKINKSGGGSVSLLKDLTTLFPTSNTTVASGTFNLAGKSFTSGGTFTIQNGATLKLTGDEASVTTPVLDTGSTVEYSATSLSRNIQSSWDYSGATLKISGNGGTFTLGLDTLVKNIDLSAGTLGLGARTLTVTGDWAQSGTGALDGGTGMVIIDGVAGSTTNITGSTTFSNLRCIVPSKNLVFEHGTTQIITGTLDIDGQATDTKIVMNSDDNTNRFSLQVGSAQSIYYVDVANSQVTGIAGHNITARNSTKTGANVITTGDPRWVFGIDISGTIQNINTSVSVSLAVNGTIVDTQATDVSGNFTFLGVDVNNDDMILIFVNDSLAHPASLVGKIVDSQANISGLTMDLNHIYIGNASGDIGLAFSNSDLNTAKNADTDSLYAVTGSGPYTVTFADDITLLIPTDVTYTPAGATVAQNVHINGAFSPNAYSVTVHGNWDKVHGTFTSTGTVTFDTTDSSTLSGSTIFYNLVSLTAGKTLTFTTDTTQTVTNALTITGTADNPIIINETGSGAAPKLTLNAGAAQNISNASVSDNDASGGLLLVARGTSTLTNTTHWVLGSTGTVITWTGAVDTDWNTPGNWDLGLVPSSTDTAVIPDTVNQPNLTGDITVKGLALSGSINAGSYTITVEGDITLGGTIQGVSPTIIAGGYIGTRSTPVHSSVTGTLTLQAGGMNNYVSINIQGTGSHSFQGNIPGFVINNSYFMNHAGQSAFRSMLDSNEVVLYNMPIPGHVRPPEIGFGTTALITII